MTDETGTTTGQPIRARPRVRTVKSVGDLLSQFTPLDPAPRLIDLARALNWDPATTHRIINALIDIRLVAHTDEGRYALGPLVTELNAVYLSQDSRRRQVREIVMSVCRESGLTTQVGRLKGTQVMMVESCESTAPLRATAMMGEHLPVHASAAGKAILATLTDEEVTTLLPVDLERFTPKTIPTLSELLKTLRPIRATGLARAEGEFAPGLFAVATVLPNAYYDGEAVAITCVGPPPSVDPTGWTEADSLLRASAARVRDGFGRGAEKQADR